MLTFGLELVVTGTIPLGFTTVEYITVLALCLVVFTSPIAALANSAIKELGACVGVGYVHCSSPIAAQSPQWRAALHHACTVCVCVCVCVRCV